MDVSTLTGVGEVGRARIAAVAQLGQAQGDQEGVDLSRVTYEKGYGGLIVEFTPGDNGAVRHAPAVFDPNGAREAGRK